MSQTYKFRDSSAFADIGYTTTERPPVNEFNKVMENRHSAMAATHTANYGKPTSNTPEQPRAAVTPVNYSALITMFDKVHAGGHAYPCVWLDASVSNGNVPSDVPPNFAIKLYRAGRQSKNPGSITIVSGDEYLGRIPRKAEGIVYKHGIGAKFRNAIETAIASFIANPLTTATRYGRDTGICCFCGRTLTESHSILHGYGPICAERWGLPHYQNGTADAMSVDERDAMKQGTAFGSLDFALQDLGDAIAKDMGVDADD